MITDAKDFIKELAKTQEIPDNLEDYLKKLWRIQDGNLPARAILLPSDETIYNVNLNTRVIEAPEILSAKKDHLAETIFFAVDRYYDNMDLTKTVCVVQYVNENATDEDGNRLGGFLYLVPFYDIAYFQKKGEDKILIPWAIGGPATAAAGPVTFALRFYLCNSAGTEIIYSLNTLPASSRVLESMDVIVEDNQNFMIEDTTIQQLYAEINNVRNYATLRWLDL